jgi:hypothetical protein
VGLLAFVGMLLFGVVGALLLHYGVQGYVTSRSLEPDGLRHSPLNKLPRLDRYPRLNRFVIARWRLVMIVALGCLVVAVTLFFVPA